MLERHFSTPLRRQNLDRLEDQLTPHVFRVTTAGSGLDDAHHLHALYHPPARREALPVQVALAREIQFRLVVHADEKLGVRGIRPEPTHRDRAVPVLEAGDVGALEWNRRQFRQVFVHAQTALNHFDLDGVLRLVVQAHRAVEGGTLVPTFVHVPQEIRAGDRGLTGEDLEHDLAEFGLDGHPGVAHAGRVTPICIRGSRLGDPSQCAMMRPVTALALGLVLVSAVLHATWNLLAKRVGSGAAFLWLACLVTFVCYAPVAVVVVLLERPQFGSLHYGFMAGSAVLHTAYFLMLQAGYRVGDLSLVYPLARGTGPLLSTLAAIALFAERPTPLALAGALLVTSSVFVLSGGHLTGRDSRPAVVFGLLTGALIAAYTLWDKHAVSALLIPPLLYDWVNNVFRTLLLTPGAARDWGGVKRVWAQHKLEVFGVGLLSPLAYILVLTALRFTDVHYVAPAREVSILFATLLGARLLNEGDATRRLGAAGAMVAGVVALALG